MRVWMGIVALLLTVGLVGCSGNDGDDRVATAGSQPNASGSANAGADRADAVAFTRCMRQHGVDMPDPNPDIQWGQLDETSAWDAAWEACRNLLPPAPLQTPSAEELEQYRLFAVCMRAHDIEMGDPDETGDMTLGGWLEDVTKDQLTNDPRYKAAYTACKDKLPGSATPEKATG